MKQLIPHGHFDEDSDSHGSLFESLIKLNNCKNIIEIGVATASLTRYLCRAAEYTGGFVYGYDNWETHGLWNQFPSFSTKETCDRLLKAGGFNNFELIKIDTYSKEFSEIVKLKTPSIDFVFIDGCHSYKGIKNDFDVVYPLMSPVGIIAFHDTLRIDGCREFIVDVRTKSFDGSYDIVDFPFGSGMRRVGISLLVKRSYPLINEPIDEVCGSISNKEQILQKEKEWYDCSIEQYSKNNI